MTDIKTDPKLLDALRKAAGHKLSAEQLRKQKISFIMGSLKKDSSITREFVEQELNKLDGEPA